MTQDEDRARWLVEPDFLATMPTVIHRAAARGGAKPLIVGGARELTYAQALDESAAFARILLRSGVGKGTRVAILLPNSPEWIIAFFAVTRIGAVAVLVHTMYQRRELEYVLRHADVHTLITRRQFLSHDYLERVAAIAPAVAETAAGQPLMVPELPYLRQIYVWGGDAPDWTRDADAALCAALREPDDGMLERVEAQVFPSDLGYMMYTSGSTADPKGVMHTQGSLVSRTYVVRGSYCFEENDRILIVGPFCWAARFMSLMLATYAGATLICPPTPRIDDTLDAMVRERPTLVAGPHTLIRELRVHPRVQSGEIDEAIVAALERKDADGELLPQNRLTLGVGMTETVGPHSLEIRGVIPLDKPGTFGRAVPDIERRIRHLETGEWLGPDEVGELCLRGPHLMDSYYKKERWQVFGPDGFFATGDLCSLDADGCLIYYGRNNEMIKTSGANVSPREVEALLESYPEVQEAGVFGLPSGDHNEMVTAVIVPSIGFVPDIAILQARMRKDVSTFKVPKAIYVRRFEELPRTGSGKLDKRKVRADLIEQGTAP